MLNLSRLCFMESFLIDSRSKHFTKTQPASSRFDELNVNVASWISFVPHDGGTQRADLQLPCARVTSRTCTMTRRLLRGRCPQVRGPLHSLVGDFSL